MAANSIRVEFYGIPRRRAGVAETTVQAVTLGEALAELVQSLPGLAPDCIQNAQLTLGITANLNGQLFIRAPETPLAEGDTLLILSSDVGG